MLTLYTRPGCPYCKEVKEEGKRMKITFDERSILDPSMEEELVEKGGKRAVPFLVDSEAGVSLYGSDKIINHLHQRFK